jgi:SAM-dependent methyltransferase
MSLKYFVKKKACRLCNGKQLEFLLKLPNIPLVDDYCIKKNIKKNLIKFPLELVKCLVCNHVQLSIVVNPNILYKKYIYESSSSTDLKKHFRNYFSSLTKKIDLKKDSLIVDIGSNDGLFLKNFKPRFKNILGIDPSPIAKIANQNGIKTIQSYFDKNICNQIIKKMGYVKLITANNVFSHINDLNTCLINIKNILEKNGIFVFEVFHLLNIKKNKVIDYVYHEHLDYHSVKALKKFFLSNMMKIIDIEKVKTKGGSIRVYVAKKNSKYIPKNRKINLIIKEEIKNKIFSKNTYGKLYDEINNKKDEIIQIIKKYKKKKFEILSYGASATSTVINILFSLNKFFKYIVDDNKKRQNRYSPYFRKKVVSKKIFKDDKKYLILVSAWRFFDEIVKNNLKSKRYKHIKFLRILPCIEIK